MTHTPLVSVIIPAYQGQQRIARAVRSILAQDYSNWEIVIISDDLLDYEQVLADQDIRNPNIKYCSTGQVASGEGNARNVGLLNVSGDYVVQLDCDDAFHPARISKLLPLVKKYGAAISNIEMIDDASGVVLPNYNRPVSSDALKPEDIIRCSFHTMNVAMFDRNKVLHLYKLLDRYADYIFLMQMFNVLPCIGYSAEPLYQYYKYDGSITNFSDNPDAIAHSFTASAQKIKHEVMAGKIEFNQKILNEVVCHDMNVWINAQAYFVQKAKGKSDIKFHDIIGSYLEYLPQPSY